SHMSEPSRSCTILRCCSMTWYLGTAKSSFRLLLLPPMLCVSLTETAAAKYLYASFNGWVAKTGPHRTTAAEYYFGRVAPRLGYHRYWTLPVETRYPLNHGH